MCAEVRNTHLLSLGDIFDEFLTGPIDFLTLINDVYAIELGLFCPYSLLKFKIIFELTKNVVYISLLK